MNFGADYNTLQGDNFVGKVTTCKGIVHASRKKSVLMRKNANLETEMIN